MIEIKRKEEIVNIKNGGHVISRSEKRVKHIVLIYNAQNKESRQNPTHYA
jgi:hypothetical protein